MSRHLVGIHQRWCVVLLAFGFAIALFVAEGKTQDQHTPPPPSRLLQLKVQPLNRLRQGRSRLSN
jgi:hypothetical protein